MRAVELGDFAAAERVANSIPTADYRNQSLEELAVRKTLAAKKGVNGTEWEEPWSLAEVPDELATPAEKARGAGSCGQRPGRDRTCRSCKGHTGPVQIPEELRE